MYSRLIYDGRDIAFAWVRRNSVVDLAAKHTLEKTAVPHSDFKVLTSMYKNIVSDGMGKIS